MRVVKQVIFNDDKAIDEEMLKFIESKTFSTYAKELILKDMQQKQVSIAETSREELKDILKELLQEIEENPIISKSEFETEIEEIQQDTVKEDPSNKKTLDGIGALTF